jgi:hypothetical protein
MTGTVEPSSGVQEEQIIFTGVTQNANGTATLTGVSSVGFASPYTQTSGFLKNHAGNTTFVLSDTAYLYSQYASLGNNQTFTGSNTFNVAVVGPTPTLSTQLATKGYVDGVAIAGAAKASTTVFGISELSTAPVTASVPIAVGDNDTRVPTQGENDALVGQSGTAVGSTNKFEDAADVDTAATASKVVRRIAAGQITVPATPSAATDAASKGYVDAQNLLIIGPTASNTLQQSADTEESCGSNNTVHTLLKSIQVFMAGTIRVKFDLHSDVTYGGSAQIYKNGVAYGTGRNKNDVNYTTYSEDLIFAVGDFVQVYAWASGGGSGNAFVRNFRIYYDKTVLTETVVRTN